MGSWSWAKIFSVSASQLARITSVNHWLLASVSLLRHGHVCKLSTTWKAFTLCRSGGTQEQIRHGSWLQEAYSMFLFFPSWKVINLEKNSNSMVKYSCGSCNYRVECLDLTICIISCVHVSSSLSIEHSIFTWQWETFHALLAFGNLICIWGCLVSNGQMDPDFMPGNI
jgi:hypothetical protein